MVAGISGSAGQAALIAQIEQMTAQQMSQDEANAQANQQQLDAAQTAEGAI